MKSLILPVILPCFMASVAVGCGEDSADKGGSSATAGTSSAGSGSGGNDSGGGTGGGGNAGGAEGDGGPGNGGGGGAVNDGGPDSGAHCTPGVKLINPYPAPMSNCPEFAVRNIALSNPIGPGDTLAFSAELATTLDGTMELWGASEKCGTKLELLATGPLGVGTRCVEVAPKQGTYPHLIWVWHGGGMHAAITLCRSGSCAK
jgi:hypothetical protein